MVGRVSRRVLSIADICALAREDLSHDEILTSLTFRFVRASTRMYARSRGFSPIVVLSFA